MTGMHAAYAFLLGHVLSIYMAREHSTSMSQVRCHDILVVAPYILWIFRTFLRFLTLRRDVKRF